MKAAAGNPRHLSMRDRVQSFGEEIANSGSHGVGLVAAVAYVLVGVVGSGVVVHWALRRMGERRADTETVLTRIGRGQWFMRLYALGGLAAVLMLSDYATLVRDRWALGELVLIDEWVLFAPFAIVQLAGWYLSYPADRLIRETILQQQLALGLPIRPIWRRCRLRFGPTPD